MSLTHILKIECPTCHKLAIEQSKIIIGKTKLVKLQCGHLINAEVIVTEETVYDKIEFADGGKPRPYQIDAVKFGEQSGIKFILADEQGLGKTIEVFCLVKLHPELLLPLVYVCPTTVKLQVMREIHNICGSGPEFLTQVIQSGKEKALPGFKIYIITYDMLKKEDVFQYVPDIKAIFIDECQRIKNHLSDRAKAVQRIAEKCEHIVPMSGTPIKNHSGEYFTVLNLVAPTRFPHYQTYLDRYCQASEDSAFTKVMGLKDAARFHEMTKDIIIRRTKAEVLPDLPSLDRKFFHVELDASLDKAYAKALAELDELMYSDMMEDAFTSGSLIIAIMAKLRHIVGVSKVPNCVEWATDFLLSTDRKLTIFTEHTDVANILKIKLDTWLKDGAYEPCLHLHSGLDSNARQKLVDDFKDGKSRIMIAATKAAGEGLNLQFCSDAVMLERQWNPANEEQAEARFHRFGQLNSVTITYLLASGTIDEYFTELVERKRAIVAQTMDNKEVQWEQASLMKELAMMLTTKGKTKWRL